MRILLYVRRGIRTRAEVGRGTFYMHSQFHNHSATRPLNLAPGAKVFRV